MNGFFQFVTVVSIILMALAVFLFIAIPFGTNVVIHPEIVNGSEVDSWYYAQIDDIESIEATSCDHFSLKKGDKVIAQGLVEDNADCDSGVGFKLDTADFFDNTDVTLQGSGVITVKELRSDGAELRMDNIVYLYGFVVLYLLWIIFHFASFITEEN